MKKIIYPAFCFSLLCSQAQVNLSSGLYLCYPFDGNAIDYGGFSHNGTVVGATASSDRLGNPLGALLFDGVTNCVKVNQPLPDMPRFSVSLWTYHTRSQGFSGVLCDATPDLYEDLVFDVSATDLHLIADKPGGSLDMTVPTGQNINNAWHHLVWICDSASQKVYLDTVAILIINAAGTNVGYHNTNASIGREGDDPGDANYVNYYQGKMDDYRIYTRALNYAEVQSLYHARSCISGPDVLPENHGNNSLRIYPNPGNGKTMVDCNETGELLITDISGRTVGKFPLLYGKNVLDLSSLDKGMYSIQFITEKSRTTAKLVLE